MADKPGTKAVALARLKVASVTALGGATLASVAAYFVALGRALWGGDARWSEFFASNLLWFLYLPLLLGAVYFYARVRLGGWLLEQGALDEALAYSGARQRYSFWLRGKREALIQRLVVARVGLKRLDARAAERALYAEEELLPERAKEILELELWRALAALRNEHLVNASRAVKAGLERRRGSARARAALRCAAAMLALRSGDLERAKSMLDEAVWLHHDQSDVWYRFARLLYAEALGDQSPRGERERELARRERLFALLQIELPGALPEARLIAARLAERLGQRPLAEALRQAAIAATRAGLADARSEHVVRHQIGPEAWLKSEREEQ